ncbi:MAG: hypothetical protein IH845_00485 [Nanoarchaeota archaeon]|nr:hypothetical protein [Nanoarchaeota archaeon]
MEKEKIFNIRNYLFDKLFFSKKVIINKPGVIINRSGRKYGGVYAQNRTVYLFEDTFADLQMNTITVLGKEKTSLLFYEMGKDAGLRYLIIGKAKRPPRFMLNEVIQHVFTGFRASGLTLLENFSYDSDYNNFVLSSKNSIILRKTKDASYICGFISSILSFLLGENIESEFMCYPNGHCRIILNKKIKKKYIPNEKELEPFKDYNKNFPKYDSKFARGVYSYDELIKFKNIQVDKNGITYFMGAPLIPIEFGCLELIAKHYNEKGIKDIFEKSITSSSNKIAKSLVGQLQQNNQKLKLLKNMFSGLGFGILFFKLDNKHIIVNIVYAPISRYKYSYVVFTLKGFLEEILGKKLQISKISFDKNNFSKELQYTLL